MTVGQILFSFQGRISRGTYLKYGLVIPLVVLLILGVIDAIVGADGEFLIVTMYLFFFVFAWPSLALQAKRWHDRDKSAWFVLVNFIPLVGAIWSFVELCFLKGTEGANQYGVSPTSGNRESRTLHPATDSHL